MNLICRAVLASESLGLDFDLCWISTTPPPGKLRSRSISQLTLLPNRSAKPGVAPSKIQSRLFVEFPEIAHGPPFACYVESPAGAGGIPGKSLQAGDQPGPTKLGLLGCRR